MLLPPSETKISGGDPAPLSLTALSFAGLNPIREQMIDAVTALAADVPASLAALGLSERGVEEVRRNDELRDSPTMAALRRYTGVLYDALDASSLSAAQWAKAHERIAIVSALFGAVRAHDPIPAYRLSAGSSLPDMKTIRSQWTPTLGRTLSTVEGLIIDLRSGPYAALAKIADAVVVRVVTDDESGVRKAVSHHNKAYKGQLVRALVQSRSEPTDVDTLATIAQRAGLDLRPTGPLGADLVVRR